MIRRKAIKNIIAVFLAVITLFCSLPTLSFAADSFETSISAFPESYKPYLRDLHEKHPKWKFEALITGLDWTASVNAEYAPNISLVINHSAYTDIFKSREASDYNASTGKYDQKDAGFVRANKLAVSYYMDPRNFLNERGIFQFEKLSFDEAFSVTEIESILKGSYMENSKIEYYNEKGEKKTINEKYSEVIYNAGKTYNINPCFLASKIINEVGKSGTGTSVSGKNSTYPGIYNYYNIGAYDGPNPATAGLKWASSGTSYGRPWNTPKKSIMGGAQYNAENYIGIGQNTGYLQRFNVNPNAKKAVYTHQYMTNLAGAASPAYATYNSYLSNNILENGFIFLIPVFKNMPAEKNASGTIALADGKNQKAKTNSACNVRTGPSTENTSLGFTLPAGTAVSVIESVFTDAKNQDTIMRYPFWSKIKFTYNSQTYTGYVYSNFLNLTTQSTVKVGAYTPIPFKTNKDLQYRYISSDPSVATVVNDTSIKFLKEGTVFITAYDSLMHYQVIKYNVVKSTDGLTIANVKASNIKDTSVTVSFTKNSNYSSYEVYVANSNGKLIKSVTTSDNSASVSGLSTATSYNVYVRGLKSSNYSPVSSAVSFKTSGSAQVTVNPVTNLKAVNSKTKAVAISWTASSDATGYKVYTYDEATKKYTALKDVGNKTSFTDESANAINTTYYSVRAYKTVDATNVYSSYCPVVTYTPPTITVARVTSLEQSSATKSSVKLTWDKVANATSYQVYKYNDSTKAYEKVATASTNSAEIKSLSANSTYSFKVRAVYTLYGKNFYGLYSSVFAAYTATADVTGLKISDVKTTSYKLSWNKVSGATGYYVMKYDTTTKKYVKIKATTALNYTVTSLKAGQKDTYKIRAYKKTPVGTLQSALTSAYYAACAPAKPGNLKASGIKSTSATLTWSKVSGADGYAVYVLNTKTNKYEKVLSTTGTTASLSKLTPKTSYTYVVKAYCKTSSMTSYSSNSTAVTFKTLK